MVRLAAMRGETAEWLLAQLQAAHDASVNSRNNGSYFSNSCATQGLLLLLAGLLIVGLYLSLAAGGLPVRQEVGIPLFVILTLAVLGGLVTYPCFKYSNKVWPDFVALVEYVRYTLIECGLLALVLHDAEGERLPALRQPTGTLHRLNGWFTSAGRELRARPLERFKTLMAQFSAHYEQCCIQAGLRAYPAAQPGSKAALAKFGLPRLFLQEAIWLVLCQELVHEEFYPSWLSPRAQNMLRQRREIAGAMPGVDATS
jgi:hypothetical protein